MTLSTPRISAAPVWRRISRLLGWLSLFATLALLSPGIVATANAEETAETAPSCPISREADEHSAVELSRMIEQLRSEVAERPSGDGDVVPLNTRGYNYPTGTRLETDRRDP